MELNMNYNQLAIIKLWGGAQPLTANKRKRAESVIARCGIAVATRIYFVPR